MGRRATIGPLAASLALLLLTPFLLRVLLLLEYAGDVAAGDLMGFLADVTLAAPFLALAVLLSRVWSGFVAALTALWVAGHWANHEHVVALGALASLREVGYLGDGTFLVGSALAVSRPYLLIALAALSAGGLAWMLRGWRGSARWMLAAFAVLALQTALPLADSLEPWRQSTFVHQGARAMVLAALEPAVGDDFASPPKAMLDLHPDVLTIARSVG